MKGDIEISMVAKWLILLVLLALGVGLMLNFSGLAKNFLGQSTDPKSNTTMVQAQSFSDSQIKLYLKSCETMVGERTDEDFSCYILEGDMKTVNPQNLTDTSFKYPLDFSSFNPNSPIAEIKYTHIPQRLVLAN